MSTMKWTYKENVVGTALKDIGKIKKGGSVPVQVYEFYVDSRGGSSTTTRYYYGMSPKPEEAPALPPSFSPPTAKEISLGQDFELKKETPISVSTTENKDKKWILYVVLAVAGYFAYKKFKK